MKRHTAFLAVTVAVVAIGVAPVLIRRGGRAHPVPVLLPWRAAQVHHLFVRSGNRDVSLTRTAEGTWRSDPGSPPQAATRLFSAEDRLLPLRGYRTVNADPSDPQYGLREPTLTVRVETASGAARSLALGAPTFTGGGFYAHVSGEGSRLHLVPRQTMSELRSLIDSEMLPGLDPSQEAMDKRDHDPPGPAAGNDISPWLQQVLRTGARPPQEVP